MLWSDDPSSEIVTGGVCEHIHLLSRMVTHGHTRTHGVTHEHTRTHGATRGHTRTHTDTGEHLRTYTNTREHIRTHANTYGHTRTRTRTRTCTRMHDIRGERDLYDLHTGHGSNAWTTMFLLVSYILDMKWYHHMNKRAHTCQARGTRSQIQCITLFLFTAGCLATYSWTGDRSTYSSGALACRSRREEGRRLISPTPSADAMTCRSIVYQPLAILQRRPLSQRPSMRTDSNRLAWSGQQ